MRAVQHSSETVEHYTPPHYVSLAKSVMGDIDLDPASCEQANRVVQARAFYSERGLEKPWYGRVYLNPPGGSIQRENQQAKWYATLADRLIGGLVTEAVFMCFNLELFRYAQRYHVPHPLEFPTLFPTERIPFLDADLQPQKSPGHPNAIIYMGPNAKRFAEIGSNFGKVLL